MAIVAYTPIQMEVDVTAPKHLITLQKVEELLTASELEIDCVTLAVGDRVLLAGQTNGVQNEIYTVEDAGSATSQAKLKRASDFASSDQIQQGVRISVIEGDTQANSTFRLITGRTITLNSTVLEFLSVTPATDAAKYAETITGDSLKTSFDVTHNLGTTDVNVQIYNQANKALVLTDVTASDGNNVAVGFASAAPPSDVSVANSWAANPSVAQSCESFTCG